MLKILSNQIGNWIKTLLCTRCGPVLYRKKNSDPHPELEWERIAKYLVEKQSNHELTHSPNLLNWFNEPETVPLTLQWRNNPTRPNSRTRLLFVGNFVNFTGPRSFMWTLGLLFPGAFFRVWVVWNLGELRSELDLVVFEFLLLLNPRAGTLLGMSVTHKMLRNSWNVNRTVRKAHITQSQSNIKQNEAIIIFKAICTENVTIKNKLLISPGRFDPIFELQRARQQKKWKDLAASPQQAYPERQILFLITQTSRATIKQWLPANWHHELFSPDFVVCFFRLSFFSQNGNFNTLNRTIFFSSSHLSLVKHYGMRLQPT